MELSPLQIAGQTAAEVVNTEVSVGPDDGCCGFLFNNDQPSLPQYESMIYWDRKRMKLLVGTAIHFDLGPLSHIDRVAKKIDQSVSVFLEGIYDAPGELVFHNQLDDEVVPAYEGVVEYEALDNDELSDLVRKTFVRGVRALTLLCPIFARIEKGAGVPSAEDRLTYLTYTHGSWEVQGVSNDCQTASTRLPTRLFGGIKFLGRQ